MPADRNDTGRRASIPELHGRIDRPARKSRIRRVVDEYSKVQARTTGLRREEFLH